MAETRICIWCKEDKGVSDFHKSIKRGTLQHKCKECMRKYHQKRYASKKEHILSVASAYKKSDRGRVMEALHISRFREKYPEKRKAETCVTNALRQGRLVKQHCEVCGDLNVEAHHASYAKEDWLKIQWLCKKHHMQQHFPHYKNLAS